MKEITNYGGREEQRFDWEHELAKSRMILLTGEISERTVHEVCTKLTILDDQNQAYTDENGESRKKPIFLYINSYGGSIYDGLAVIDTMRSIESPVVTVIRGKAMSMGAAIAVMGDIRYATDNSRIMFHEAASGAEGKITTMEEEIAECRYLNDQLAHMISEKIGMDYETYSKMVYKKDVYVSADEALAMHAVDKVIKPIVKNIDPDFYPKESE